MTQSQIKHIFFIITSCLLFLLDLALFSLLQHHSLHLLLCFFITLICQHPSNRLLVAPLLLLSLISYLDYEIFGWCLVYLVPTMALARFLDKQLRVKLIIPYLLLIFALFLKMFLASYMLGIDISWMHAFQLIFYNSLILSCFIMMWDLLQKIFGLDATIY